jgi:chromosome partitioning protein
MDRRVVALATMKGGSGKSTLAVCLAARWWQQKKRVAIVDADPQRSVMRWRDTGDALDGLVFETADDANIGAVIERLLDSGVDRVVVDTPGFRAAVTDVAITRAGLCLIPVRPSPVDFEIAADGVELIAGLKASGSDGPRDYRFVLTQTIQASVIARHMRAEMAAAGYPVMEAEIGHRVAYPETALMGATPSLVQPRGTAAREIAALAREVDTLLDQDAPR